MFNYVPDTHRYAQGTLFVRGWEIQTWTGDSLIEHVNQRIYRSLYCIGTCVIVFSLAS